jgi:hypothetical protein
MEDVAAAPLKAAVLRSVPLSLSRLRVSDMAVILVSVLTVGCSCFGRLDERYFKRWFIRNPEAKFAQGGTVNPKDTARMSTIALDRMGEDVAREDI